jgi:CheY-like chemotaxis protein
MTGPTIGIDSPTPARSNTHVLIVEDDDDVREVIAELLAHQGCTMDSVRGGEEALRYLECHPSPRLILVDLSLPHMSGAELMRCLNDRGDRSQMKVLLASGWDDIASRATALGADGYIRKPYDLDDLTCMLKDAPLNDGSGLNS